MVALQPWQISQPPACVRPVRQLPNGRAEPRRLGSGPRSRSSPRRPRGTTDETACLDRRGGRRCGVLAGRIGDRLEPMANERDHDGAARSPSGCARRAAQRARPGERRRDASLRWPTPTPSNSAGSSSPPCDSVTRPNASSTRRTVQPECPNRTDNDDGALRLNAGWMALATPPIIPARDGSRGWLQRTGEVPGRIVR